MIRNSRDFGDSVLETLKTRLYFTCFGESHLPFTTRFKIYEPELVVYRGCAYSFAVVELSDYLTVVALHKFNVFFSELSMRAVSRRKILNNIDRSFTATLFSPLLPF